MISISIFALLLATYCYSVPVDPRIPVKTPEILLTTGKTIIEHDSKINMHLMSEEESTNIPNIHKSREVMTEKEPLFLTTIKPTSAEHMHQKKHSSEEPLFLTTIKPTSAEHMHQKKHSSEEPLFLTTIKPTSAEDIRHKTRSSEEPLFLSTTIKPMSAERHPSEEMDFVKNLQKFYTTTMETKAHFEKKAIMPLKNESSEIKPVNTKRAVPETSAELKTEDLLVVPTTPKNMKVDKSGEISRERPVSSEKVNKIIGTKTMGVDKSRENSSERPTSSEKFGKKTGLLKDKSKEVRSEERSNEETTPTRMIIKNPTITKIETIMPVKITETKITGEKQPVIEKEKSDN